VKSWVTGMLKWPTLGRTPRPRHYLHGNLSSQSGIFNCVLSPSPYLQVIGLQKMPSCTFQKRSYGMLALLRVRLLGNRVCIACLILYIYA
jgi:hypothetical protein